MADVKAAEELWKQMGSIQRKRKERTYEEGLRYASKTALIRILRDHPRELFKRFAVVAKIEKDLKDLYVPMFYFSFRQLLMTKKTVSGCHLLILLLVKIFQTCGERHDTRSIDGAVPERTASLG